MSAGKSRSRTPDPLTRLTTEEREAATLARLATSVSAACDVWLASRGIGPGKLFTYDGPAKPASKPPDARAGDVGQGEGQATPGGREMFGASQETTVCHCFSTRRPNRTKARIPGPGCL